MKKFLLLAAIVSVMVSCQDPDDNGVLVQQPEYEILRISDNKAITCSYAYPSVDCNGNEIMLSSALVAWKPAPQDTVETLKSVIIGCHITITADDQCPTQILGSIQAGDAMVMASLPNQAAIPELRRSIVIMPDYEGYGISRDHNHPYLVQELTARQIADAVKYGLQLYRDLDNALKFDDDWKTICLGYSQGGAAALATHKYIEQHGLDRELHFAGSFCGSGPYDLLQTFQYYFEDDGNSFGVETRHKRGTTPEPLVIPFIINGMIHSNPMMKGHTVSQYLSKQFIDTGIMDWIDGKELNTDQIRKRFYDMCINGNTASDGTYYSPEQMQELFPSHTKSKTLLETQYRVWADLSRMFTGEFLRYWNGDMTSDNEGNFFHDMMTALEQNSLVNGWDVRHRIVFLHSRHDTTVPYSNYLHFSANHPEAQIRHIDYGKSDHEPTGTNLFLSLTGTTFHEDFTWLFAEKQ